MERPEKQHFKADMLNKYGTDLTKMAQEGKLDQVVGRRKQIERVTQILCKRRKDNPCLIGDPGVGKTVIVEGLAASIVEGTVPSKLEGKKIFALDMARLVAGTKFHGDFEERLTGIVDEVKQNDGNIVLFIDELHTLVGNGQTLDAANIIKPALARGELKCIGATTIDDYRRYIEKDGALRRRFLHVDVPEPSIDEAVEILKGIQGKYEAHHDVKYADEALVAAVHLSNQYISGLFLPDKAIDLIDEAGARVQLRQAQSASKKLVVTEEDIQAVVSMVTGIPLEKVTDKESSRLLNMEAELHKYIIGQEEAVKAVSHAIRRARVGIKDPNKPIASFLFTGPTGVGKTELAKALAVEYFGSKEAVVRIDMSEYMEKHAVSKLFGSPPGYIGYDDCGQLTEAVRRRAHTVVLFDEIEKAYQDVHRVFLQILDDGTLTDGKGRKVDFKNTIIIMTSNIGNSLIAQEDEEDEIRFNTVKLIVAEELKKEFSPEFLNRIDEVIVFRKLKNAQLKEIADLMLEEVYGRLKAKNIIIRVTDGLKRKIIEEGNNLSYGARPLKRAVVRLLEDSIAEGILNGLVGEGRSVILDVNSNGNVIMLHCDVAVGTKDYEHSMI
ncbi:PREDICTED: chaperone protein ClpC2, chloroplastic-like [Populus euphratica]|uniref:Chaperone protein ClpC2, chloroplastic-like n=1 Tax=Populus euphratica TaxID=75702 RepID=A0AAJ6VAV7_POPEU|nr:PREDICTED: chaperone protein ClpC2, chloroplastic-like [Populus euphratica]